MGVLHYLCCIRDEVYKFEPSDTMNDYALIPLPEENLITTDIDKVVIFSYIL